MYSGLQRAKQAAERLPPAPEGVHLSDHPEGEGKASSLPTVPQSFSCRASAPFHSPPVKVRRSWPCRPTVCGAAGLAEKCRGKGRRCCSASGNEDTSRMTWEQKHPLFSRPHAAKPCPEKPSGGAPADQKTSHSPPLPVPKSSINLRQWKGSKE